MQLVYYSHSYREPDNEVVSFFLRLMRSEGFTPSLDPPSNRLNSAKPEGHLRSTDGMVCVLTQRAGGVSQYMLYEISLALRSRKPLLVFVEDVLPDGLVPSRVLQRRFSRRGLLRQVRDHRHAMKIMSQYVGAEPPPAYQPGLGRRNCVVVGASQLGARVVEEIEDELTRLQYRPVMMGARDSSFIFDQTHQETLATTDLAICFVSAPEPLTQLIFGALRAFLTPTILLTADANYPFHPHVPREYQPAIVDPGAVQGLRATIAEQIEIFEEEYVDLEDQQGVVRYAQILLKEASETGDYSARLRDVFINNLAGASIVGGVNVSQDRIDINNVGGIVNVKSSLNQVTQKIQSAGSMPAGRRDELAKLINELSAALAMVEGERPQDAERVVKSAEMVVSEVTKEKPNASFLKVTVEGLKEAAKAVEAIAPAVLSVAAKIAAFALA